MTKRKTGKHHCEREANWGKLLQNNKHTCAPVPGNSSWWCDICKKQTIPLTHNNNLVFSDLFIMKRIENPQTQTLPVI